MKIVGLTGGIGCGKSSVSKILMSRGILVIDADLVARQAVEPGRWAYKRIVATFGRDILATSPNKNNSDSNSDSDSSLHSDSMQCDAPIDRVALGDVIFRDESLRRKLNSIAHPAVFVDMIVAMLRAFVTLRSAVVLDVPLLFEAGGFSKMCSSIAVVYLDAETALERILRRDEALDRDAAKRRIDAQWPIERKVDMADIVLRNTGTLEDLERATVELLYNPLLRPTLASRLQALLYWLLFFVAPILLCLHCVTLLF
jgi:dephospho-CoA kinase